ncbi:pectinesterase-like [Impatiens glandulifera]|uniref:pectinesterase-like n=1 Tax=Impatiens glandulifera TaxID=253017 RepID=UPI001FB170CC|nr:pectinesterase-like [Impatiens glandulifera]
MNIVHIGWYVDALPKITYVAKDGTGEFSIIGEAINAIPNYVKFRTYIKIKPGIYMENIVVPKSKTRLTLLGSGIYKTIVSGSRSNKTGFATDKTPTADIIGDGFVAKQITFENTAGPSNNQAVALKSEAEFSAFYRCRFLGFQDTLYAKSGKQFYRECEIHGTVDFIMGNAAVVFQNCEILVGRSLPGKPNVITAQDRDHPTSLTGTVFHNCTFKASRELQPVLTSFKTYLGRPWKVYSRVVIMQSYIDNLIDPKGWLAWDPTSRLDKLYYGEYGNKGPGAVTTGRVTWPGRILLNTTTQASPFTVRNFIQGHTWIPDHVPYHLDLI